ncbi:MAG: hypothetical protein QXO67_05110 [Candidatus Bathyarchaeia archaeon]
MVVEFGVQSKLQCLQKVCLKSSSGGLGLVRVKGLTVSAMSSGPLHCLLDAKSSRSIIGP